MQLHLHILFRNIVYYYTFEELKWDEVPILIFKVLPIYRFEMGLRPISNLQWSKCVIQ
jgi:hypothetical protein